MAKPAKKSEKNEKKKPAVRDLAPKKDAKVRGGVTLNAIRNMKG